MDDIGKILALRRGGMTCRGVAEDLDIEEWRVWYVMKITGHAGAWHYKGLCVNNGRRNADIT